MKKTPYPSEFTPVPDLTGLGTDKPKNSNNKNSATIPSSYLLSLEQVADEIANNFDTKDQAILSLSSIIEKHYRYIDNLITDYYFSQKHQDENINQDIELNLDYLELKPNESRKKYKNRIISQAREVKLHISLIADLLNKENISNVPAFLNIKPTLEDIIQSNYEPNYTNWAAMKEWLPQQAACLMCKLNPNYIEYERDFHTNVSIKVPARYQRAVNEKLKILQTWRFSHPYSYINQALNLNLNIHSKLWKAIENNFLNEKESDASLMNTYQAIVKKISIPPKDLLIRQNALSEPRDQPYLDENHPNFAIELKVAINAWVALFADDKNASSSSIKKHLIKWLEAAGWKTEGEEIKNRITTIITPNRLKTKRGSSISITKQTK